MKVFTDKENLIVILEKGEEIISSLTSVCEKYDIKAGFIMGIGAGKNFEIGYYDINTREYIKRELPGEYEIISMLGTVSVKENKHVLHVHIGLADHSFHEYGGHLFKGEITGTGEIYIFRGEGTLIRRFHKESNLSLIEGKEG